MRERAAQILMFAALLLSLGRGLLGQYSLADGPAAPPGDIRCVLSHHR